MTLCQPLIVLTAVPDRDKEEERGEERRGTVHDHLRGEEFIIGPLEVTFNRMQFPMHSNVISTSYQVEHETSSRLQKYLSPSIASNNSVQSSP